jgi:ubiquinone/menaquinone biosynthesis C-methylase UbiE
MSADAREPGNPMDQAWSKIVAGWERHADWIAESSRHVIAWMIGHLSPKPGQTILELGAGPGDTGFEVAKKLGPKGKLISSDLSPEMSDVAKRRVARFGVDNVDFRIVDGQKIDLPDDSVDGILHKFGPMLMVDQAAYASEIKRVLRPRGHFAGAVWAAAEKNPWLVMTPMSVVQSGIEMPPFDPSQPGGPFSFGDSGVLGSAVADVGFGDVVIEAVDHTIQAEDFEALWTVQSELSGPIAAKIMSLPNEKVELVKETFRTLAEPYRSGGGYSIPGQALCVSAR